MHTSYDGFHIRWLIRRDLDEVLTIDRKAFADFWSAETWLDYLRQRNCIAQVVELDNKRIVGVILYALHKDHYEILRLCVAPEFCGQGYGTALVEKVRAKLSIQKRRVLAMNVSEYDVPAQRWLSRRGFWAHPHGDQIRFEYVTEEVVGPETIVA